MSDKYILEGHETVKCKDFMKWAKWFEAAERHVAHDEIEGAEISTVFLGRDHSFGEGPPMLFETMIFGGPHDQYQERCSTWDEAVKMHKNAIALVKSGPPS